MSASVLNGRAARGSDAEVVDLRLRRRLPAHALVDRPALVSRLAASPAPLTVVAAPAGYGKTTLLAQWARSDPRRFAWIDIAERHDDPERLLASIIERLDAVERLPGRVIAHAGPGRLLAALDAGRHPAVLVLDDAHPLRSAGALELVSAIAAHLGPGSRVVVASRCQPALPLGRLRAGARVLELGAADLAMSDEEAGELLRLAGRDVQRGDLPAILGRAEGWAAALHLAARALHDGDGGSPAAVTGDHRLLADYVRLELLAGLDAGERELLVRTSPFDELSGGLCDAVLGRRGSGLVLRALSRRGVPLTPLDPGDRRFRLNRLVAEALRSELRRGEPHLEQALQRRASAWFEATGAGERAIEAAIAGGDLERAARLIATLGPALVAGGRASRLERSLGALVDPGMPGRPMLALAAAVGRLARLDRDVAEHLTASAERGGGADAAIAALRAAIARDGLAQMRRDAARCLALSPGDSAWRPLASLLEGVALHLSGRGEDARIRLEQAARLGTARLPLVRALALTQLALLALAAEDVDEARETTERVLDELAAGAPWDEPALALAFAGAADVLAGSGRADEARRCSTQALRHRAALVDPPPWYEAELRISLARAELRLSNAAAARGLLAKASRAARRLPECAVIQRWIDDAWLRADLFAVGAVPGPQMLTLAELRVLRFLPSHLSFREIATRLHVSANTVKTQAHAVYRKLDVSSRSEAVGRACDIGLVDG